MYRITIQHATDKTAVPPSSSLRRWAKKAMDNQIKNAEVTLRIVGAEEMTQLNSQYRHKKGPTNVLSFPIELPTGIELDVPMLGDIVICTDVVVQEAIEQGKPLEAHWAHMVVHGIFHLLGYDHENEHDANIMEGLETKVMLSLGFADPYDTKEKI
jgi:probable rRNA maturation factor